MLAQRNPKTSYRVEIQKYADDQELSYRITEYKDASNEGSTYKQETYMREDALPEWVIMGVRLLDISAVDGIADIPFFGEKNGPVYWFYAQQVYKT